MQKHVDQRVGSKSLRSTYCPSSTQDGVPILTEGCLCAVSIRKTMYSNRKFDIIDPHKCLIQYLLLICLFIYIYIYIKYSILYYKYVILCRIYSILTSKYQNKNFPEKSAFGPGLLLLRERDIFFELFFSLIPARPLYQNVRIDHRIIFPVL